MAEPLSNSTPDGTKETKIDLETKFSKKVFKITWRLTNFALCQYKVGEYIDSLIFATNFAEKKKEWYLRVYPFGVNDSFKGSVSLNICCKSQCRASVELKLLNQRNVAQCEVSETDFSFSGNNCLSLSEFVKRDRLFEENSGLLVNGAMNILCVITLTGVKNIKHPMPASVVRSTLRLSEDLGGLLKSSYLSDVTVVAGGRMFQAHRAVLAARSPVFSAMFDHEMTETISGIIEIPDITAQAVEALLNFIYTGECQDVSSVAQELFQISEKYLLYDLKNYISDVLFGQISAKNAASVLVFSDLCNDLDLKDKVLRFVTTNVQSVVKSKGWKEMTLNNPRISIEVQSQIIDHMVLQLFNKNC